MELFLRLGGVIVTHFFLTKENALKEKNALKILCIGDSVTFGVGAPSGKSYPAQLQTLLEQQVPQRQFFVINRGVPGLNSSQALKIIKHFIPLYKPDICLMLCGNNDYWNWDEVDVTQAKTKLTKKEYITVKALVYVSQLRIYKLYQNLVGKNRTQYAVLKKGQRSLTLQHYDFWNEREYKIINEHVNTHGHWTHEKDASWERNQDLLDYILTKNTEEICAVAWKYNTKLFFLSYPAQEGNKRAAVVKPIAKKNNVGYIDNSTVFKWTEKRSMNLFSDPFHPNADGYYYMATTVYNTFVDEGIIAGKKLETVQ
jgi:lysophospholipase L1-like esterase